MNRYFFDVRDGDNFMGDEEGLEFATLLEVELEAVLSLMDLNRTRLTKHERSPLPRCAVEVRDNSGPVMLVALSVAMHPTKLN
jgi:hypothetical protein